MHPARLPSTTPRASGEHRGDATDDAAATSAPRASPARAMQPPASPAPSTRALASDETQAGTGAGGEKRVAHHALANSGRGGKVLKLPKKSSSPARCADTSNITTPGGRLSEQTPIASTSTAKTVPQVAKMIAKPQPAAPKGKARTKTKTKDKGKERFTPVEYAQRLQTKFSEDYFERRAQKNPALLYLKGKTIFYFGGDAYYAREQTTKRMDIVSLRNCSRWCARMTALHLSSDRQSRRRAAADIRRGTGDPHRDRRRPGRAAAHHRPAKTERHTQTHCHRQMVVGGHRDAAEFGAHPSARASRESDGWREGQNSADRWRRPPAAGLRSAARGVQREGRRWPATLGEPEGTEGQARGRPGR